MRPTLAKDSRAKLWSMCSSLTKWLCDLFYFPLSFAAKEWVLILLIYYNPRVDPSWRVYQRVVLLPTLALQYIYSYICFPWPWVCMFCFSLSVHSLCFCSKLLRVLVQWSKAYMKTSSIFENLQGTKHSKVLWLHYAQASQNPTS